LRRPEWLEHANGAQGVVSITGAVSDLSAALKTHAGLFGRDAVQRDDQWLEIDTGHGRIVLGTPAEINRRYQEAKSLLGGPPRLAAVTLRTNDLEQTARLLSSAGVTFRRAGDHSIIVPPGETCGIVLEFVKG
jgi:hypothetical protein